MSLNDKQQRFIEEYLVDLNATQAAIRAGYSEKTSGSMGHELLKKPEIQDGIAKAQKDRSNRTKITQDMVMAELAKIGFSDIRKAVRWGNTELRLRDDKNGEVKTVPYHGLALISSEEVDDETAAAISEVSEDKFGLKVKFHDKRGALVELGKHLGLVQKVELTGKDGEPIQTVSMTKEEYKEARKEMLDKDEC